MTDKIFKLAEDEVEVERGILQPIEEPKRSPHLKEKEFTTSEPLTKEMRSIIDSLQKHKTILQSVQVDLNLKLAEIEKLSVEKGVPQLQEQAASITKAIKVNEKAIAQILHKHNVTDDELDRGISMLGGLLVVVEKNVSSLSKESIDSLLEFLQKQKKADKKFVTELSKYIKEYRTDYLPKTKSFVSKVVSYFIKPKAAKTAEVDVVGDIKGMFDSLKDMLIDTDNMLQAILELNNETTGLEEKLRSLV